MLEFKKYSSIENSFIREFMEHVVAEMPQDLEYVVQEKVHGAYPYHTKASHEELLQLLPHKWKLTHPESVMTKTT